MSDELLNVSMNCAKENSSSNDIRRALEYCGLISVDSVEGAGDFPRREGEDIISVEGRLVVMRVAPLPASFIRAAHSCTCNAADIATCHSQSAQSGTANVSSAGPETAPMPDTTSRQPQSATSRAHPEWQCFSALSDQGRSVPGLLCQPFPYGARGKSSQPDSAVAMHGTIKPVSASHKTQDEWNATK